jgi:hypothetical protein
VEKKILVAGTIPFLLGKPLENAEGNEKKFAINELAAYLHCFLDGNIYLGDLKKSSKVIESVLTRASIVDNVLYFSFPEEVTSRFLLEDCYVMPLKRGAAFKIYNDQLKPQSRLTCRIVVREESMLYSKTVMQLQKIVMRSKKNPRKISIGQNRQTKRYDIRITFTKDTSPMIRDQASSLNDAITAVASHLA